MKIIERKENVEGKLHRVSQKRNQHFHMQPKNIGKLFCLTTIKIDPRRSPVSYFILSLQSPIPDGQIRQS